MQFIVGLKNKSTSGHLTIDAEDALVAALKAKTQQPEFAVTYVRRQNRRGDSAPSLGRTACSRGISASLSWAAIERHAAKLIPDRERRAPVAAEPLPQIEAPAGGRGMVAPAKDDVAG